MALHPQFTTGKDMLRWKFSLLKKLKAIFLPITDTCFEGYGFPHYGDRLFNSCGGPEEWRTIAVDQGDDLVSTVDDSYELSRQQYNPMSMSGLENEIVTATNNYRKNIEGITVELLPAPDNMFNIAQLITEYNKDLQDIQHSNPAYPDGLETLAERVLFNCGHLVQGAGENLLYYEYDPATQSAKTADEVLDQWVNSPEHYDVIVAFNDPDVYKHLYMCVGTSIDNEISAPLRRVYHAQIFIAMRQDPYEPGVSDWKGIYNTTDESGDPTTKEIITSLRVGRDGADRYKFLPDGAVYWGATGLRHGISFNHYSMPVPLPPRTITSTPTAYFSIGTHWHNFADLQNWITPFPIGCCVSNMDIGNGLEDRLIVVLSEHQLDARYSTATTTYFGMYIYIVSIPLIDGKPDYPVKELDWILHYCSNELWVDMFTEVVDSVFGRGRRYLFNSPIFFDLDGRNATSVMRRYRTYGDANNYYNNDIGIDVYPYRSKSYNTDTQSISEGDAYDYDNYLMNVTLSSVGDGAMSVAYQNSLSGTAEEYRVMTPYHDTKTWTGETLLFADYDDNDLMTGWLESDGFWYIEDTIVGDDYSICNANRQDYLVIKRNGTEERRIETLSASTIQNSQQRSSYASTALWDLSFSYTTTILKSILDIDLRKNIILYIDKSYVIDDFAPETIHVINFDYDIDQPGVRFYDATETSSIKLFLDGVILDVMDLPSISHSAIDNKGFQLSKIDWNASGANRLGWPNSEYIGHRHEYNYGLGSTTNEIRTLMFIEIWSSANASIAGVTIERPWGIFEMSTYRSLELTSEDIGVGGGSMSVALSEPGHSISVPIDNDYRIFEATFGLHKRYYPQIETATETPSPTFRTYYIGPAAWMAVFDDYVMVTIDARTYYDNFNSSNEAISVVIDIAEGTDFLPTLLAKESIGPAFATLLLPFCKPFSKGD